jgi:hypothetical protein
MNLFNIILGIIGLIVVIPILYIVFYIIIIILSATINYICKIINNKIITFIMKKASKYITKK